MAMEKEALTNTIESDLAKRNRNWTQLDTYLLNNDAGFKSLMFNCAIATASSQYVKVGFRPKAVIFFATVPGAAGRISWGIDDGITPYAVASYHNIAANANTVVAQSIRLYTAASVSIMGRISSFSTSGFTITWTKAGSPTGDAQIIALALR